MIKARLFRTDFQLPIRLLSPLHIGSGESLILESEGQAIPDRDTTRKKASPLVALVVKDNAKNPVIPATSIKGVLRRITKDLGLDPDQLFGCAGDFGNGVSGSIGALFFHTATIIQEGPAFGAGKNERGIYLSSRTRIDPGRGTSDSTGLFSREMITPDTLFDLRIRLEANTDEESFKLLEGQVRLLLSQFTKQGGLAFGSNTTDGDGRMRPEGSITIRRWQTDSKTFEFVCGNQTTWQLDKVPGDKAVQVFEFSCDAPFLIIDSQFDHVVGERNSAQIMALRKTSPDGGRDIPVVSGSSISGALRARAEWLRQIDLLRNAQADTSDQDLIVTGRGDLDKLDPVQHLFGVTGAKAKLKLRVSKTKGNDSTVTSVKIDRFSGAPIQNALFTTETGLDVGFQLSLSAKNLDQVTQDFLDRLTTDIVANGITLGHGASKGFGWFSCEGTQNG